jgi:aerobic carbon-monoxide dehydrogenase medium subunit
VKDFAFETPTSLDEALEMLETYGEDALPMAGGTALVNFLKQGLIAVGHVISLERIPGMARIASEADGLHIGALTRHRDVETSPAVKDLAPLLADVYRRVATVRVRNMATVGGGLAHADPAQDPPLGLLALDASVRLVSRSGERIVPVRELFTDYYETVIQPAELLTEVVVPPQPSGAHATYLKFLPRSEDDYATVAVAALAEADNGMCRRLRVAIGAAAPTPIRATTVEDALQGKPISTAAIEAAADAVADQVEPLDDFRGPADYKRDMAVVFTRRALTQVLTNGAVQ